MYHSSMSLFSSAFQSSAGVVVDCLLPSRFSHRGISTPPTHDHSLHSISRPPFIIYAAHSRYDAQPSVSRAHGCGVATLGSWDASSAAATRTRTATSRGRGGLACPPCRGRYREHEDRPKSIDTIARSSYDGRGRRV